MNQSTIDALKAMKFSAMAAEFERQLSDPATYGKLGFEERFSLLVDAERNRRLQNKLIRTVHKAHFAAALTSKRKSIALRGKETRKNKM